MKGEKERTFVIKKAKTYGRVFSQKRKRRRDCPKWGEKK